MKEAIALAAGLAAWLGVAVVSVLVVHYWSESQQVAAIFPIAAAVVVAWVIGEWVTERVFAPQGEEGHDGR